MLSQIVRYLRDLATTATMMLNTDCTYSTGSLLLVVRLDFGVGEFGDVHVAFCNGNIEEELTYLVLYLASTRAVAFLLRCAKCMRKS